MFNYFKGPPVFKPYLLRDYYLRVEFQARGAPHIHCLLWLDEETKDNETDSVKYTPLQTMFSSEPSKEEQLIMISNIEKYAENLISASISEAKCNNCKQNEIGSNSTTVNPPSTKQKCEKCEIIKERAQTFNNHICGFSCHK